MVHNDYTREVPPVVEIYADRLSITSYGGLVPGLSREEFFGGRSMPRNRELMRVYRDLDLIEQLGSGMNRILSAYSPDIFRISENFLEVCFPFAEGAFDRINGQSSQETVNEAQNRKKWGEKWGENERMVMELIDQNMKIPITSLAEKSGLSTSGVEKIIKRLKEAGVLERKGPAKGGYWEITLK